MLKDNLLFRQGKSYCKILNILELTQRRQHAKNDEDREWTFHQSLLDSKGRRAFSARGRGRAVVGTRSNNS